MSKEHDKEHAAPQPVVPGFRRVIRAAWNYDGDTATRITGLACRDPSLAVQSQKDEADINTIVRNFGVTGHLPVALFPPSYGDFTAVSDYQGALQVLEEAENAFMALPSAIRAGFGNDPGAFVRFCEDRENLPQLREWGLAPPAPEAPKPPSEPAGA